MSKRLKTKTLKEVYDWLTNGVFEQLEAFDVPWKSYVSGDVLDLDYYGNRSGKKLISPLVRELLDANEELPAAAQAKLAGLLFYKYGEGWTKAWTVLHATYNPIHNYDSTETRTPNITKTETPNITETETPNTTETRTPNLTDTRTPNLTETETPRVKDTEKTKENHKEQIDDSLYGFNSSTAVPASSSTREGTNLDNNSERTLEHEGNNTLTTTGTDTTTKTGTETVTKTGTHTKATTGTKTEAETGTETITKAGNIGTTKTQEMIQDELTLRFDTNFFDLVYKNVDEILTINVFKN